jgi:hypothetical protein
MRQESEKEIFTLKGYLISKGKKEASKIEIV